MKTTRTILVFLATYLAQFLITILLVSLVTTTTLEEALYSGTIKGLLVVFGWIIPIIVASEYYKEYA
jgi:uncharacterized membrane protein required for colicin V production